MIKTHIKQEYRGIGGFKFYNVDAEKLGMAAIYNMERLGNCMEDIEHRVRQKYIAEVQSRPATLKKIHLYKSAKKIGGHC